jgi:hypothetical protein
MNKEQKRIEQELLAFEKNIWGDQARKDSLDSIANAQPKGKVKVKKSGSKNRRANGGKSEKVSTKRSSSSSSSSSGSSSARVTVRRQRH